MRVEQLEYLCEAAKRKSMNIASDKLHVSQQTLSTAVKSLETELGVKLLERTYHGVFPTTMGQEVINLASDFLGELEQLKLRIAAQQESNLVGELSIVTDRGINMMMLPKINSYFYKYYPGISLNIQEMKRAKIEALILAKKADIGIIADYDQEGKVDSIDPNVIFVRVVDFSFFARVSRNSPLASESVISLRSLLNYPLALYDIGTGGKKFNEELKKYGEPKILFNHLWGISEQLVSDNLAVSLAVKANNYLPRMFNEDNGTIVTIPIKEMLPFTAGYLIHHDNMENTIIKRFIDVFTKIT